MTDGPGGAPRGGPRGALGVFGGTFDPIHLAHLAVAEAARDALDLHAVLFVPAARPPHKADRVVTPAAHRLAMVRAAIADNDRFEASTIELEREGPSYTIDTLRALTSDPRAARGLALIMSAEALAEFPLWREPARILDLATLVVVPRAGYPNGSAGSLVAGIAGVTDPRIVVLDGPRMQLSASELRARARDGRSLRYLVPDAVAGYIGDHGLYQPHAQDDAP